MRTFIVLAALALLGVAGSAAAQLPPPEWSLQQNDPNPFCNNPGWTAMRFGVLQTAEVRLEIWSPDTTAVVRTLVHGMLPAGMHEILWDGKDSGLATLSAGSYPYTLTALESGSGAPLFHALRIAVISCTTPSVPGSWGRVKSNYRE